MAGVKNNSWTPPLLREKVRDTRMQPGSRTATRLNTFNKLYYNFSEMALVREDKKNISKFNKSKRTEPRIVLITDPSVKIPASDAHILPGRVSSSISFK